MNKFFTKFIKIAIVILLLTSCQPSTSKKTQKLRLNLLEGDLPSLHPHPTMGGHLRARSVAKALYEGLTRINSEGEAELAEAVSVDISPCQTQYIFKLRENYWSDGTAVTAFHYEKAWKQAIAPASDCTRADFFYVIKQAREAKKGAVSLEAIGIKALDEKTLLVELNHPTPYFLKLIASPLFAPIERESSEPNRFNGPFMVEKWKKGDWLLLKANPHYWDHKQVGIEQIEIRMITDSSTVFSMYEKKEIDWIGDPFGSLLPEMTTQLQKKGKLQQHPIARALWLYFNTQDPFLTSASLRKALSLAVDRSLIAEHIFIGSLPLYQPLPISLSLCPDILFNYDSLQIKELFEEGLRESHLTTPLSLTLSYPTTTAYKPLAEYLKEVWEKAFTIKVHLQGMEWNVFRSNLEGRSFQMGMCGASALYPDPTALLDRFEFFEDTISGWENPHYHEKLKLARETVDSDQRSRLLGGAEAILAEEFPIIPLCNFVALYAHHPKLKGYVFDACGSIDFKNAYFEQELREHIR